MSPVTLERQLRTLRLAATVAHALPPVVLDLVASDGRVRRVAAPSEGGDLQADHLRAAVERLRLRPRPDLLAELLGLAAGSTVEVEVHLPCPHVRDLGGGVFVVQSRARARAVFVTLLDGSRVREVVAATGEPDGPVGCPGLAKLTQVPAAQVVHDPLTAASVVFCDHEHPAGLPILEEYAQALHAACVVTELLDDVGTGHDA